MPTGEPLKRTGRRAVSVQTVLPRFPERADCPMHAQAENDLKKGHSPSRNPMGMGQIASFKNGPGTKRISVSAQGWVSPSLCTINFYSSGQTPILCVEDCMDQSEVNDDANRINFAGSCDAGFYRALSFSRAFNETAAILSTIQAEPSP
ncbi:hypothetical protein RB8923 [Rhodopirellula baltica SH 1]|uniref:Uncharacterized protein n=3 Tax=Rhodopirellula baltica TaxID=265606 RepID=Q7UMB8_RHOBA|nr:hypothetical protein RB8923 [Rhodopirellula baltica SH 1]